MNFKSSVIAAAVTLASFASFADTYNLGVISSDANNPTQDTFLVSAGSFQDEIQFQMPFAGGVDASANSITLKLNGQTVTAISNLYLQVWDNTHPNGNILFKGFVGDDTTVSFQLPSAGQYHIDVTGTALRDASYTVSLVAQPVPEPETYALMLAGLGAVGFVARRRKSA